MLKSNKLVQKRGKAEPLLLRHDTRISRSIKHTKFPSSTYSFIFSLTVFISSTKEKVTLILKTRSNLIYFN